MFDAVKEPLPAVREMPRFCAISSAASPEPSRKAFSRLPISSKRRTEDGRPMMATLGLYLSSVLCRLSSDMRFAASSAATTML